MVARTAETSSGTSNPRTPGRPARTATIDEYVPCIVPVCRGHTALMNWNTRRLTRIRLTTASCIETSTCWPRPRTHGAVAAQDQDADRHMHAGAGIADRRIYVGRRVVRKACDAHRPAHRLGDRLEALEITVSPIENEYGSSKGLKSTFKPKVFGLLSLLRQPQKCFGPCPLVAAQQPDKPGRSEAIRRLIEFGLDAAPRMVAVAIRTEQGPPQFVNLKTTKERGPKRKK